MLGRLSLCLPIGTLLFVFSIVSANGQSLDERLQIEVERLLTSYGEHKGYSNTTPSGVEATLTAHRKAVFNAGVRAMFVEILQNDGTPTGHRVIDFVDAVTGIWGVRPGEGDGKYQFRLSIRWDVRIAGVFVSLETYQSENFTDTPYGHVLMPGGDDEQGFSGFDVRTNEGWELSGIYPNVHSFRHITPGPSLQVSYLREDASYGEIDIDFDPDPGLDFLLKFFGRSTCHEQPSNSDPLSVDPEDSDRHSHLKSLNFHDLFKDDLTSSCLDSQNHCKKGGYENPPCGV